MDEYMIKYTIYVRYETSDGYDEEYHDILGTLVDVEEFIDRELHKPEVIECYLCESV